MSIGLPETKVPSKTLIISQYMGPGPPSRTRTRWKGWIKSGVPETRIIHTTLTRATLWGVSTETCDLMPTLLR